MLLTHTSDAVLCSTSDGCPACSYIANETPGTKQAKLRMLQQRGWAVLPLTWIDK